MQDDFEKLFSQEKEGSDPTQWMLSYIDLISLLTAFFVMLYSMSAVKNKEFKELSKSLNQALNSDGEKAGVSDPKPLSITKVFVEDAVNLDYLNSLLYNKMSAMPELSRAALIKQDNHMVISLSAYNIFSGDGELSDEGKRILPLIADIISPLNNQVEVVSSGTGKSWESGLSRALIVADFFKKKGYFKEINSFSGAVANVSLSDSTAQQQKSKLSGGLDIIIEDKVAKTFDY